MGSLLKIQNPLPDGLAQSVVATDYADFTDPALAEISAFFGNETETRFNI
jgi:hypothetical protein